MSTIELETKVGVTLSVERYNELIEHEQRMYVEQTRKIRAYQALRHVCGGTARDFNLLEPLLDRDEGHTLSPGIAIVISEADKDWVVPIAHSRRLTLGDFMQTLFDKAIAELRAGDGQ